MEEILKFLKNQQELNDTLLSALEKAAECIASDGDRISDLEQRIEKLEK